MITPRNVLANHIQHYPYSCAASGMELVVKLHGFESDTFQTFQDRYGNKNIGFEKLSDLLVYGIDAKDCEMPIANGFHLIENEVDSGKYPLVSLPNLQGNWHIWIAVREASGIRFLSRGYQIPFIIDLPNSHELRNKVAACRGGKVHFAIYNVENHTDP